MRAYYNDSDRYVAAWLRNLIAAGLIPDGDVDERDIHDVQPADLRGYGQVHLFAGIGGWSYALQLAGWPPDAPIWTGSCPCQPYSTAGKGGGDDDPRNLWPEFRRLVAECKPPTVVGEQVASADGRAWLAGVRADLENLDYAVGAADLCAASVGAPHIRQRLYWLADAEHTNRGAEHQEHGEPYRGNGPGGSGAVGRLADANGKRRDREPVHLCGRGPLKTSDETAGSGAAGGLDDAPSDGAGGAREAQPCGNGANDRLPRTAGPWSDAVLVLCADGKTRRLEPGLAPLAHGVPTRVGKLRAYGNAVVPALAAEFVRAYMEVTL